MELGFSPKEDCDNPRTTGYSGVQTASKKKTGAITRTGVQTHLRVPIRQVLLLLSLQSQSK